jgi:transposase
LKFQGLRGLVLLFASENKKHSTKLENPQEAHNSERQYPQYTNQSIIKNTVRQHQKRLSEGEIKAVIAEYQGGATVYELADKFNCHRETISRNLKKSGLQPTIKKFTTQAEIDLLATHYTNGMKLDDIAKQYGVAKSTIRITLRNSGVKMRTRWDY